MVSDSQGLIVSVNAALAKLVGKDAASLKGQPLKSIINFEVPDTQQDAPKHPLLSNNAPNAVADGKTSSKAQRLASIIGKTGAQLVMPVSHVPINQGEETASAAKTAAAEKTVSPKAASTKSTGAKTAAAKTAPTQDATGSNHLTIVYILQANSLQQAQTDFVSTVSHELRTPLTSIKGFADTILRAGDRLDVSQQRRYVGIIKDQADRLTRLVEDLLAVSRLESKRLQFTNRAIDLQDAVERVQLNLAEKAEKHKIVIDIPAGLPPVWADADRLEQILTNLIDNAIKYSQAGTTVTFLARSIMYDPGDGANPTEMVEFLVSDQGVGIPEEHLPKIFHKFSRLDNPLVRQTEGTGLGLYITRSLALALDGDITVASGAGGSTFTVRLPAATYEKQAQRGRDLA